MPFLRLALLTLSILASFPALAEELAGRVVGVHGGDTLTLLTPERRQVKVRLHAIDTPESRQPYGTRARQELAQLAFQKVVRVAVIDTDRYGRTVGQVCVGGLNVNVELVRRGAAWVYRQYNRDPRFVALEEEARQAQRGLWVLPQAERVPP
ncbi:thermonuclease family protein [Roseomonas ludipueritiae]|uniref:Thermonuclease family protein n=2 Tax=Pseudoroseomonas ludipueritiae TaxID=198093 RepID=A0ABR7R358_9PROT|nr:thermonuclease family protein [Pseudoroseomonas ludipueritiae]